jgi:hypothetical protein
MQCTGTRGLRPDLVGLWGMGKQPKTNILDAPYSHGDAAASEITAQRQKLTHQIIFNGEVISDKLSLDDEA